MERAERAQRDAAAEVLLERERHVALVHEQRAVRARNALGRLLRDGGVDYKSRPTQFLSVKPNSEMMGVFWMREPRTLFGRQTAMSVDGRKIGDIVEILPLV